MIEEILRTEVKTWKALGPWSIGAWLGQEFTLRHGRLMKAQADMPYYAAGFQKLCFSNTIQLVRRRKTLTYVEGYARHPKAGWLLIHHAWAMDRAGNVVDITLQKGGLGNHPSEYEYFGVPISREEYRAYTTKRSYSVFDTGVGLNTKFFFEKDPELAEIVQLARETKKGGAVG